MATILIIEDDAKITTALTIRLKSSGYDVLTAPDGFEGLRIAMSQRPDLILMDVVMPVGLGFSVAERLRTLKLPIPVIFLTASKRTGLRKMAEQLGAAGYFEKPYDSADLLAAIGLILGKSSTVTSCPSAAADAAPA